MENEIVSRATRLFLEHGYKTVTMDDIAMDLNISKKTIYVYFSSKPQLIERSLQLTNNQYVEQIITANNEKSGAISELVYAHKNVKQTMDIDSSISSYQLQKYYPKIFLKQKNIYKKKFLKLIKDNLLRGIREEVYRSDLDLEFVARFHLASYTTRDDQDYFPPSQFSHSYLVDKHLEHYMRSICTTLGLDQYFYFKKLLLE